MLEILCKDGAHRSRCIATESHWELRDTYANHRNSLHPGFNANSRFLVERGLNVSSSKRLYRSLNTCLRVCVCVRTVGTLTMNQSVPKSLLPLLN